MRPTARNTPITARSQFFFAPYGAKCKKLKPSSSPRGALEHEHDVPSDPPWGSLRRCTTFEFDRKGLTALRGRPAVRGPHSSQVTAQRARGASSRGHTTHNTWLCIAVATRTHTLMHPCPCCGRAPNLCRDHRMMIEPASTMLVIGTEGSHPRRARSRTNPRQTGAALWHSAELHS